MPLCWPRCRIDLRTPLASVLVAAGDPDRAAGRSGRRRRRSLARSIQGEARRLDRYIGSSAGHDAHRGSASPSPPRAGSIWPMPSASRWIAARKVCAGTASISSWPKICPCSAATRFCWSMFCSICWTTPRNIRYPARPLDCAHIAPRMTSRSRSPMKEKAFRRPTWSGFSRSSFAPSGPGPDKPGDRAGTVDLPRLCRGDGRPYLGAQLRRRRRGVYHHPADPGHARAADFGTR